MYTLKVKVTQSCPTLWDPMDCSPWNSPGQNTGVGSLCLLQGIFPTQGSSPGLPHCKQILYQLSHKGSPEWENETKNSCGGWHMEGAQEWRWKRQKWTENVVQSLSTILCDPMDCSMSGFLVLHYLPKFAQTHVHWVGDAIQQSHPLLHLLLLLPSIFPSIRIFSNE